MSSDQNADPYDKVIADLRAKREQIDQTITLLEAIRGGGSVGVATGGSTVNGIGLEITETAGTFLGMSIVDAAKKLLALRKRTMGNVEIARELQAGGLVLTSQEPANVIGSVLTRRFNQIGDVVKVGRGIWGLKEWYPGRSFKPSTVGRNLNTLTGGKPNDEQFIETDEGRAHDEVDLT
jgi:hypothetical protein